MAESKTPEGDGAATRRGDRVHEILYTLYLDPQRTRAIYEIHRVTAVPAIIGVQK